MPLKPGGSKKTISYNIRELMLDKPSAARKKAIKSISKRRGITEKEAEKVQAAAISFAEAKRTDGRGGGSYDRGGHGQGQQPTPKGRETTLGTMKRPGVTIGGEFGETGYASPGFLAQAQERVSRTKEKQMETARGGGGQRAKKKLKKAMNRKSYK